jgi:hypothetical protein
MNIPSQKIITKDNMSIVIAAEGEFQAAVKLGEAADIIALHPVALQLHTLHHGRDCHREKINNYFPGPIHDDRARGNFNDKPRLKQQSKVKRQRKRQ